MAGGTHPLSCSLTFALLFLVAPLFVAGILDHILARDATIPAPIIVSPSQYWYLSPFVLSSATLMPNPGRGMMGHGLLSR